MRCYVLAATACGVMLMAMLAFLENRWLIEHWSGSLDGLGQQSVLSWLDEKRNDLYDSRSNSLVAKGTGSSHNSSRIDLHIVFITDCSSYVRWMAFTVFHSARIVGQDCPITWVRCSCSSPRPQDLQIVIAMYPHAQLLDLAVNKGKTGPDFVLGMGVPNAMDKFLKSSAAPNDDQVLAFIDVDMIFLSPLRLDDLGHTGILMKGGKVKKTEQGSFVGNKIGVAAHYWCCDSLGSPFIMTVRDWRTLVPAWKFQREGNRWGVDQEAFAVAAKKTGMQFNVFDHLMASALDTMPAGWDIVRAALRHESGNVCLTRQFGVHPGVSRLPIFLHVVQPWIQKDANGKDWGFSKYQVPPGSKRQTKTDGIMECEYPFFAEPPASLIQRKQQDAVNGWVLCTIIHSLNSMLLDYKKLTCPQGFNWARALKMDVPLAWTNSLLAGFDGGLNASKAKWVQRCTLLDC